jgi:hypothetical protein
VAEPVPIVDMPPGWCDRRPPAPQAMSQPRATWDAPTRLDVREVRHVRTRGGSAAVSGCSRSLGTGRSVLPVSEAAGACRNICAGRRPRVRVVAEQGTSVRPQPFVGACVSARREAENAPGTVPLSTVGGGAGREWKETDGG